jgi:DNA polymerase alpha subunit B
MGPFVDCRHEKVKIECDTTQTFEEVFVRVYNQLKKFAEQSPQTHVVVVPSLHDVHHTFVFPQPPFDIPSSDVAVPSNLHFVSNPAYFLFNGILIGACSVDVLKHLAREETRLLTAESTTNEHFVRLIQHLIRQQR